MTTTVLAPGRYLLASILAFVALVPAAAGELPLGTAFTYQGQLVNGGTAQNGPCDFRFKLFNAATAGSQVGSTQTLTGVSVSNGLFTVSIDFGAQFVGFARWLETSVTCPSGGSFTTLTPRQRMSPAPNAIYAENASVKSDGATVTGNGTADAPLALQNPLGLLQNSSTATITGTNFGLGAGVPLLVVQLAPPAWRSATTILAVITALSITALVIATLGRTNILRTLFRTVSIGVATMVLTYLGGSLVG